MLLADLQSLIETQRRRRGNMTAKGKREARRPWLLIGETR